MKYIITSIIISMSLLSCKQKKSDNTTVSENVVEIPEDFVSFYEQFHTDSTFQMEHIVFPLSQKSDSTKWTRANWTMHKPFDNQDGNYMRELDNFEEIVIETIREKNGAFVITRRFSPIAGEYHLIYYSIENRLEGWVNNGD